MRRKKNQFCYFEREIDKAKILVIQCEVLISGRPRDAKKCPELELATYENGSRKRPLKVAIVSRGTMKRLTEFPFECPLTGVKKKKKNQGKV